MLEDTGFQLLLWFKYEVWSKNNRYFQISWVSYVWLSHFFSVMLARMSVIYVDNISHFGLSVCFWQMKRLVVFRCTLRIFTIRKNGSQKLYYVLCKIWFQWFVSSCGLFEQIQIVVERRQQLLSDVNATFFFCSKFSNFGTILDAARFMPKTSVKIACHEPL